MTRFIHQTDCFHPHGDPDDHYDLATVYALAARQALALDGIIFDYPPAHRPGGPAALAMAQFAHLTGVTGVPFTIGSPRPLRSRSDALGDADPRDRAAAEWLCRTLAASPEPIVINIVGACTDVALAGLLRPELFAEKCRCIYLNAGAANPGEAGQLEYNVRQNPGSYAAIFDLPCPIFWAPCWHRTEQRKVGENGTWYAFQQEAIFEHLADPICNLFLYMLSRSDDPKYLRYLHQPVDAELRATFGAQPRSMWSTAAIFHAAGLGVDIEQGLLPRHEIQAPLFEFAPITITCTDDGETTWHYSNASTDRLIFRLLAPDRYPQAMTTALATLLATIPHPHA